MSVTPFNEDSRVKIPALLHLERLGYRYLSLKDAQWNKRSNIFTDIFETAVLRNGRLHLVENTPFMFLHYSLLG